MSFGCSWRVRNGHSVFSKLWLRHRAEFSGWSKATLAFSSVQRKECQGDQINPFKRLLFRARVPRVMETHTKIRVCTTYWVVKWNAFQTLHNLYSLSFDLIFQCGLRSFTKGGAAACPVIPGFPLQAATNEAHLPVQRKQSRATFPKFNLLLHCRAVNWGLSHVCWLKESCVKADVQQCGDVSPAAPTICDKVEYRDRFQFIAQKI